MTVDGVETALVGYEEDFFLWTQQQAESLRRRNDRGIDWENVAEEIESLGKSDRRQVDSRLEVVLLHLINWQYQPEERKGGWQASIMQQRFKLGQVLDDSPSLRKRPAEVLEKVYRNARRRAFEEMRLISITQIPEACPFAVNDVLSVDFLPTHPVQQD